MMTHDEMVTVIQAHKEGKKIEGSFRGDTWGPVALNRPSWNFADHDYRVKREPKVIYMNEYEQPVFRLSYGNVYQTREEAEKVGNGPRSRKIGIRKFVEVLEDE